MAIQRSRSRKRLVLNGFFLSVVLVAFFSFGGCNSGDTNTNAVRQSPGAPVDLALVKSLFNTKCVICHGEDGKMNYAGAKDLTLTQMSKEEIITQIKFGKGSMPPQNGVLDDEQIEALADYTLALPK